MKEWRKKEKGKIENKKSNNAGGVLIVLTTFNNHNSQWESNSY